jgi:hypothetical protein
LFFPTSQTLITVPKAISIGKWRVFYAPFIFVFIGLRVANIFSKQLTGFESVILFFGIIALAFIYWSIAVARWRVWAFSNVTDIRWLHERALAEHILPSDAFFRKIERKTDAQKVFWAEIEQQLKNGQSSKQTLVDYELQEKTLIFVSKWQFWWIPLLSVVVIGGIYHSILYLRNPIDNKTSEALLFLTPIVVLIIAKEWWKGIKVLLSTLEPVLILSNEGIESPNFGKKKWVEIVKTDVITQGYGDKRNDELQISCSTGDFSYTFFDKEAYEERVENEDDEADLDDDYVDIDDFIEEIDEATFEAHKNDDRYEKYEQTETLTKNLENLTVSPEKLEYLIKVYQARGASKRGNRIQ